MSNNIFNSKRFQMLFKQHFIHNGQLLLLSTVAYVGVIFIVLSISQAANNFTPFDEPAFQAFMIAFVSVFAVLYVGHAFPAFRSKESTISYLMLPASTLEKFLFEFISRIGLCIVLLPVLYWVTFNVQGLLFTIFTEEEFKMVSLKYVVRIDEMPTEYMFLIYSLITGGVFFVLAVTFTGAAMFDKQPLVKTLFSVAIIVIFFFGYSYIVVEQMGVGRYNPPDKMILVPLSEDGALRFITTALFAGTLVMLFVAFRKLKEREV